MNRESPRKREIKIWKLTEKASQEIKRSLGNDVEMITAYKRNGDAIFLTFPGAQLVETNHCDGSCSVFRVPGEACCCEGAEFLDMEISREESNCDHPLVKQLTSGQVLEAIIPTAIAIYENCGCQPYAGSVIHWQCP